MGQPAPGQLECVEHCQRRDSAHLRRREPARQAPCGGGCYDQASAQYRLVVLNAFQNVADTLTALDNDAQALKAQNDSVSSANAGIELIQRQYAGRRGELRDAVDRAAGLSAGAHRLCARLVEPFHRHRDVVSGAGRRAGGTAMIWAWPRLQPIDLGIASGTRAQIEHQGTSRIPSGKTSHADTTACTVNLKDNMSAPRE